MDRCNLESSGRLLRHERWLHQLLCDADGARLEAMGVGKYRGLTRKSGGRPKWTGALYLDESALQIPTTWSRPRNVFVNSMSDLFHPDIPTEFVRKVWRVMANTPRHTYKS